MASKATKKKKGDGWVNVPLDIKTTIHCPTVGEVKTLANAVLAKYGGHHLSSDNFTILSILANIILDDKLADAPIVPKNRLRKVK